jgi:putative oxidoreductase
VNETVKKFVDSPWSELVTRWILGATFLFAAFHKIMAPESFAKAIYSYGLFPESTINLIAIILPFLELFSGFALIFGIYYRAAAVILCGLFLFFIIALSTNLIRGHQFDCGCFRASGPSSESDVVYLVIRDILFLVAAAYLITFKGYRRCCIQKII